MKYFTSCMGMHRPSVSWPGFEIEIAYEQGATKLAEELNRLDKLVEELRDNEKVESNRLDLIISGQRTRIDDLIQQNKELANQNDLLRQEQAEGVISNPASIIKAQGGLFGPLPSATHVTWTLEPNGSFVFSASKVPDSIYDDLEPGNEPPAVDAEIKPGVFTGFSMPEENETAREKVLRTKLKYARRSCGRLVSIIELCQRALGEYIVPNSGIKKKEVIKELLDILDDMQNLRAIKRAAERAALEKPENVPEWATHELVTMQGQTHYVVKPGFSAPPGTWIGLEDNAEKEIVFKHGQYRAVVPIN